MDIKRRVTCAGKTKIIAMVPARAGSTRLPAKNLALLNGRPVISYAIAAAKESAVFDKVVVNSDHPIFKEIARRHGVDFYLRPAELGSSTAKSDSVVYDFMKKNPSELLAWVNPTSPLQTAEEIRKVVEYFEKESLDSLITVKNEQVHCVYQNEPVNFGTDEVFAQTQDLFPVQPFVYSIMMWRNRTFVQEFERRGYALLSGKVGYFPISKESAIIIKTMEDLRLAEYVLKAGVSKEQYHVSYDELAEKIG